MKLLSLAIFISGRGSNMKTIVKSCENQNFPARVSCVFSNNPNSEGLAWAKAQNIQTFCVDHKAHEGRQAFENAILDQLDGQNIDLICLAGFMRILSPYFLDGAKENFGCDIINIHPSLLPLYKGTNTHERAIADGQTQSGCSVHYVTEELDAGDVIIQESVPIHSDDTPQTLAARVLEKEHIAYPKAIALIAQADKNE